MEAREKDVINDLLSSYDVLSCLYESFNPYNNPVIKIKKISKSSDFPKVTSGELELEPDL